MPQLYRASTQDVKSGRISRRYSHIVVVMQFYPRFLSKEKIDEYVHALAPDKPLFAEFKAREREIKDHDKAFGDVEYEKRFHLSAVGIDELLRLTDLSKTKDVFLVCQCESLQKCHGDLLLLIARHRWQATIRQPRQSYPTFESRLSVDFV